MNSSEPSAQSFTELHFFRQEIHVLGSSSHGGAYDWHCPAMGRGKRIKYENLSPQQLKRIIIVAVFISMHNDAPLPQQPALPFEIYC